MDLQNEFRIGMRKYIYSVSVISNAQSNGTRNAITVSSITSISIDPPSIITCINKKSSIHESLAPNSEFCINLLNEKQQDIAEICSDPNKINERFKNIEWIGSKPPIMKNALVNIICKVDKIVGYKTHSVVIGLVQKIKNSEYKNPLTYQDGMYRKNPV
jgi:flavin reductase (DIM6/NTAB) family NADH-FMN oxidoreductase RutF